MDATERKSIGKYEIKGILGRGGMGVVYLAEDERIGREVAIKTLTEGYSGQPEMLKLFYREAKAGFLQHPNIVIVYDLGDEGGTPYIVMELAKGEPLKDLLASGVPLPLIDKLTIIDQVCAALGYAHSQGVIHRDIKPANVMVKRDPILAKLVDFGIAKVQSSKETTRVTGAGGVLGTLSYMAPERLRGQQGDGRIDLFAAGVMLYLLLTGRLPFDGDSDAAIMQKLLYESFPPLSNFLTSYPPALDGILERAMAKDPGARYNTAEEFSADLHGLIDTLKKAQINELFSDAERLRESLQFIQARELLNQLVRIDPQHTAARQMLTAVNQQVAKQQRGEQIRNLLAGADGAIDAGRLLDALSHLEEAEALDPDNAKIKAKIAEVKSRKQRQEEIEALETRAASLRNRGDLTGALSEIEKAVRLDDQNTRLRSTYNELSRMVRQAAQQEQVKQLIGQAKLDLSAGRYTAAINYLQEIGKIDPESTEAHQLLQTAISLQEQDRRRKVLDQICQEIERCIDAENWERASDLLDRALEKLPSEAPLLQMKTRVALQLKKIRLKQQVDAITTRAQEIFPDSPSEALLIVQKGLQEIGPDERLLSLETSLRERMQSAEKEQIRNRYLRDAQEAIDRNQFDKAVEILESYQYEFSDATGVGELLEMARSEVAQQQRRERIAACVTEAKTLMENEQYTKAIRLLEPVSAATGDPVLARLLTECRTQMQGLERKTEVLLGRIARLRERGEFGEAIELLEDQPGAAEPGSQMALLLSEIRTENQRQQERIAALAASAKAAARLDFAAAIAEIENFQRSWGDSPELSATVKDLENRRKQHAVDQVAKALEAARAALAANEPTKAHGHLSTVAGEVEFAGPALKADWDRLGKEAAKPPKKQDTKRHALPAIGSGSRWSSSRIGLLAGGVGAVAVLGGAFWFFVLHKPAPAPVTPAAPNAATQPAAQPPVLAHTATIVIQGNIGGANVYLDNVLKDFTQADGSLRLVVDPGRHTLRFGKSGFADSSAATLTLAENDQKALRYDLVAATGPVQIDPMAYLALHSTPGAAVAINSEPKGVTNERGELILQVKPGNYALALNKSNFQSASQNFSIKAGEHNNIAIYLTPIVKQQAGPPLVVFSASATQIVQGQPTVLSWSTSNASEVTLEPGPGRVDANNQTTVTPQASTTYTLTAKGEGGSLQRTVSINVAPKPAAPPQQQVVAPPPPAPVQQQAADPRPAIQAALSSFYAAFNAHDANRMKATWSSMTDQQVKSFDRTFKDQPKMSAKESCPPAALDVSGDTADWTCTETTTIDSGGKPLVNSRSVRFRFAKAGSHWTITDRR